MHTNLGLSTSFKIFDDKYSATWSKMLRDWFNILTFMIVRHVRRCVTRYLFTYNKTVTDAVDK